MPGSTSQGEGNRVSIAGPSPPAPLSFGGGEMGKLLTSRVSPSEATSPGSGSGSGSSSNSNSNSPTFSPPPPPGVGSAAVFKHHHHQRNRSVNLSPVIGHASFLPSLGPGWDPPRPPGSSGPHNGSIAAYRPSSPLSVSTSPHFRGVEAARRSPRTLTSNDEAGSSSGASPSLLTPEPQLDSGSASPELRRPLGRVADRSMRLHPAGGTAQIRATSPARGTFAPLSPRLQALSGQPHGRRLSMDTHPPRTPSPVLGSAVLPPPPPPPPLNPDPAHPFDSIWPNDTTTASSTSPLALRAIDGIPIPHQHGNAQARNTPAASTSPIGIGSSSMLRSLSHSPRELRTTASSPVLRSSNRQGSPSAVGWSAHERNRSGSSLDGLRLSSSPIASRPSSKSSSNSTVDSPQATSPHRNPFMEALANHSRHSSSSSSSSSSNGGTGEAEDMTSRVLSPPMAPQVAVDAQHVLGGVSLGLADDEENGEAHTSRQQGSSSSLEAARSAATALGITQAPTMPSDILSSPSTSAMTMFGSSPLLLQRTRSPAPLHPPIPTRTPPPHLDAGMMESPPKTRSFIGMPPRSGYELSDDPDDVGSEDGSNGSRAGSINEEHEGDEADRRAEQDEDREDDDVEGMELEGDEREARQHQFAAELAMRRRNEGGVERQDKADDEVEYAASVQPPWGNLQRPSMPKRPSLTHASVLPPLIPPPPPTAQSPSSAPQAIKDLNLPWEEVAVDDEDDEGGDSAMDWSGASSDGLDLGGRYNGDPASALSLTLNNGVDPVALFFKEKLAQQQQNQLQMEDVSMEPEVPEDSLSTLERIFLFAKSEMAYHRVLVASELANWIADVELSDAVEYIIPLLNGLGTDEVEVCEAFTPQLHRVMWYFFRNCPLVPVDSAEEDSKTNDAAIKTFNGGDADTSASEPERATRPLLPVGVFTPLLCALLLNSNTEIAVAAQLAVVQFFARLRGVVLCDTAQEPLEYDEHRAEWQADASLVQDAAAREGQRVELMPYEFGARERRIVESELLENVALAIGRLNPEARLTTFDTEMEEQSVFDDLSDSRDQPPHLVQNEVAQQANSELAFENSSVEPTPLATDDATAASEEQLVAAPSMEVEASEKPVTTQDDTPRHPKWGQSFRIQELPGYRPDLTRETKSAMMQKEREARGLPIHSNPASEMGEFDEEAAVGRMASVSLLAALAAEGLIEQDELVVRIVPEITRLVDDPAFFVRKEVAIATGALAKQLDERGAAELLLPVYWQLLEDRIWHVRQANCLSTPSLFARLERGLKRERIVIALRTFVDDTSSSVQSAALEILGEIIYMFNDDPEGPPDHLVRFFLQEPFEDDEREQVKRGERKLDFEEYRDSKSEFSDDADHEPWRTVELPAEFARRPSNTPTFHEEQPWYGPWVHKRALRSVNVERALVMAYNFPAVVVTLGYKSWVRMRRIHALLLRDAPIDKARRSLVASLHELAKIIGPTRSTDDLVPLLEFAWWSPRSSPDLRAASVESLDIFLDQLPDSIALQLVKILPTLWADSGRDWRVRERLAQHIPVLAQKYLVTDESGGLVTLLQEALADPISAVRDAGIHAVPALYHIFAEDEQAVADGYLGMLADMAASTYYRTRIAFVAAMSALFETHIPRSSVELLLMDRLLELARDPIVDVRLGLARAVTLMCRIDELYASPQSRSRPVLTILAHLHRDWCPEVRDPIANLLTIETVAALPSQDEAPGAPPLEGRRALVLGPAGGGPHKPPLPEGDSEIPFQMDEDVRGGGAASISSFEDVQMHDAAREEGDMDPDSSMYMDDDDEVSEEVDLGQPIAKPSPWQFTSQPASRPDGEELEAKATNIAANASDPTAIDEDLDKEEHHHLLNVSPERVRSNTEDSGAYSSARDASSAPTDWLTSPERAGPFGAGVAVSSSETSPTPSRSSSDPFLSFVANKRQSQLGVPPHIELPSHSLGPAEQWESLRSPGIDESARILFNIDPTAQSAGSAEAKQSSAEPASPVKSESSDVA